MSDEIIEIRGAKLHLRRDGQGPPLLFLHGLQGLMGWTPALENLARHFAVLAPDHPGFGHSDNPDWIEDVADLGLFYLDLLDALDLRHVHVVGHSLGGWIALEMAVCSTARMKSFTLVDSAGLRVTGVPRGDMFICSSSELTRLLFADEAAGASWLAQWLETPAQQEIYDRNRYAAAKLTWQPRLFNPKLEKWLHRVKAPTHVIWGEQDKLIPPRYAAAFQERIAGAQVTMLPGCGHLLDIERPDLFADAVASFIERLGP